MLPGMLIRAVSSVAGALFMLAACGTSTTGAAAPSASASAQNKTAAMEAIKADCMKSRGFKYIPYMPPEEKKTAMQVKLDSGDYAAMKADRQKYGFGIFAEYVYPGKVGVSAVEAEMAKDPNTKIRDELSRAQREQHDKAYNACFSLAVKKVLGKTVTQRMDYIIEYGKAKTAAVTREIDGDPELVRLAGSMADCLKSKGYGVKDAKPSEIPMNGHFHTRGELARIGRALGEKDSLGSASAPDGGTYPIPSLTVEQARPHLAKEVKEALVDLDCGKDFYGAYTPKMTAITAHLEAEFARSSVGL
jgi:hypothetical protein